MRAARELRRVLFLEDGNAVFDDEICRGCERCDGRECHEEPGNNADAAEREPPFQAHVLAFEIIPVVPGHDVGPTRSLQDL